MKIRNWILVLTVFLVPAMICITNAGADAPATDVEAPVKRFLDFYFHDYKRGLPEKAQLPELASFVTPELLDLFNAAMAGEGCYEKRTTTRGHPQSRVTCSHRFLKAGHRRRISWSTRNQTRPQSRSPGPTIQNTQGLNPSPGRIGFYLPGQRRAGRIVDFAHLGTWDFMMKGNVSHILDSLARECAN